MGFHSIIWLWSQTIEKRAIMRFSINQRRKYYCSKLAGRMFPLKKIVTLQSLWAHFNSLLNSCFSALENIIALKEVQECSCISTEIPYKAQLTNQNDNKYCDCVQYMEKGKQWLCGVIRRNGGTPVRSRSFGWRRGREINITLSQYSGWHSVMVGVIFRANM